MSVDCISPLSLSWGSYIDILDAKLYDSQVPVVSITGDSTLDCACPAGSDLKNDGTNAAALTLGTKAVAFTLSAASLLPSTVSLSILPGLGEN